MLLHVSALHSFLCFNNIPLYGHAASYLPTHQLMNIGLFLLCGYVNNAVVKTCAQIFVWRYLFISPEYIHLSIYLESIYLELLAHTEIVCLTV